MKILSALLILSLVYVNLSGQNLKSPEEFLGYSPGSKFTFSYQVVNYITHATEHSDKAKLLKYGETNEGRELHLVFISSPENIQDLENIRKNNRISTGLEEGKISGKQLPIVWLSYNIHGNESVGTEAAMSVIYTLLAGNQPKIDKWLSEVVVVIDPCENPDGRDRYVNWYKQTRGSNYNPNPETWEHNEPWPGGRFNHYLFDLNRDWAWQTQKETKARIKVYHQWMPHVHVDLHEMGVNSPYFFGPSAEPFHDVITPWQREFHQISGKYNSKYFDKNGWLYYTSEVFDMFYPSYGDTWPTYNGAIGFTYEQGGSGRAGLGVITSSGDTLTLKDRLDHHYTSSLATIEAAFDNKDQLISEFENYFNEAREKGIGEYKTYLIKQNGNSDKIKAFLQMLDNQQIIYGYPKLIGKSKSFSGFSYQEGKVSNVEIEEEDLIISAYQPQSRMVKVLMEPQSNFSDSLTYDLTAWALPYVFNLETYALKERVDVTSAEINFNNQNATPSSNTYAFFVEWKDFQDVKFLAALINNGIKTRFTEEPFQAEGKWYDRGTLIITKKDNLHLNGQFVNKVLEVANQTETKVFASQTGLMSEGKDLGSSSVGLIHPPRVALINGDGVSPTAFGELWYYFDQELNYPVSIINTKDLSLSSLFDQDILILPSGRLSKFSSTFYQFLRNGGKIIALENSVEIFAGENGTLLSAAKKNMEAEEKEENSINLLKKYGNRERKNLSESVEGSIFKVSLDNTHPLAFGETSQTFLMKRNSKVYPYLPEGGWNVGVFKDDSHVSGFVGYKMKKKSKNTLAIGTESYGSGNIIYFSDSPIIRGFWHSGKLLLGNAVFFVGQ
ncbi:M14 metallopeptidase family protein [Flexithrix dorotheae]|uniref:M14 metallopeptidase family protein n=1 Tax=Flexithrix dorotheae TaxID=70993 RepID=UPI00036CEE2E|nr:M14 metallopeptidase family protein [Flexithrix dorotheae]